MSNALGSAPRIARVLSATLQAVLAAKVAGDEAAANAFMLEFSDEMDEALGVGPLAIFKVYQELFLDLSGALYSLAQYVAEQNDDDPERVLAELVRTYRKAGKNG